MIARSERIEDLIADVCRRAGGIYGDPTIQEFADMLAKHGLEIRDAQPREAGK